MKYHYLKAKCLCGNGFILPYEAGAKAIAEERIMKEVKRCEHKNKSSVVNYDTAHTEEANLNSL